MGKPFLKKILVAINGTHSSVLAAMYGIILAKQYQLKMKVVFVVDTATIKYLINFKFLVSDEKDAYKNDLKKDGQNYLDYVVNLARTKGVKIEPLLPGHRSKARNKIRNAQKAGERGEKRDYYRAGHFHRAKFSYARIRKTGAHSADERKNCRKRVHYVCGRFYYEYCSCKRA